MSILDYHGGLSISRNSSYSAKIVLLGIGSTALILTFKTSVFILVFGSLSPLISNLRPTYFLYFLQKILCCCDKK